MNYPQTDTELTQRIWQVMQWHKGYLQRIDRALLTQRIFGNVTESNDRKIRDALSELPVVWDDGYFVPINKAEAEGYIAGMKSRQASIGKRLRVLEEYLRTEREPVKVEQMRLM
jgi:hypothetical protein